MSDVHQTSHNPASQTGWVSFPDGAPEILLECREVLVINKPAGIVVQGPPGIPTLVELLKDYLASRNSRGAGIYLGVPHRLDRPVTGAILFGRHTRATRRITEQFEARQIRKVYWAVVEGEVPQAEGEWRDFVRKIPDVPQAEIVPADHPEARLAVLRYRRLASWEGNTWLEIELETGRMHQIRVQAASRGLPVLGDWQYGARRVIAPEIPDPRFRPIALHARSLHFLHPMTFEALAVVAPLPQFWGDLGPHFVPYLGRHRGIINGLGEHPVPRHTSTS